MTRTEAITYIRIAGQHNDRANFNRIYGETKLSFAEADAAYQDGQRQQREGIKCVCHLCSAPAA